MSQPVPIELIVLVTGSVVAFCLFVLVCFCTRNRTEGTGLEYQGRSTYIGPIGWFQRYQARIGKYDPPPEVNRL